MMSIHYQTAAVAIDRDKDLKRFKFGCIRIQF